VSEARPLPLTAFAPAKLNLCLYLGRKRPDGLHEICSVFQAITLADELTMEPAPGEQDEVLCPELEGPNLASTALARFRERFGWKGPPVRVSIDKHIPVAAGLGGGSADAGAVLRLAAAASGLAPDRAELDRVAMSLGADVPSQLDPGSSLVSGAGEQVERVGPLRLTALLLTGRGQLSTATVYERADALGLARPELEADSERLRAALAEAAGDALSLQGVLRNDLEAAALALEPRAGEALQLVREAGAAVALLSGSGPAAFGLFSDAAQAERARAALEARWPGELAVVEAADRGYAGVRSAEAA
jgi:4-diphosphocytidyl-2-C-methyl-D-erythritol kinase